MRRELKVVQNPSPPGRRAPSKTTAFIASKDHECYSYDKLFFARQQSQAMRLMEWEDRVRIPRSVLSIAVRAIAVAIGLFILWKLFL